MLLKQNIEQAFFEQKEYVQSQNNTDAFLQRHFLKDYKPSGNHIEVITGIRRCGKSTLMRQIMQKWYKNPAFFNFEDARVYGFEVGDFPKLDEIIGKKADAYFFDEIQNVTGWEVFVRQLHDRGAKVFVTGSNASLLSRELGTRLTGRNLRHELYPFSAKEFMEWHKLEMNADSLKTFLLKGGFPNTPDDTATEYLQTLLKDIVLRDIAVRHGIKNTQTLMEITLHLISNIGKETTYSKLKRSFGVASAKSVSDYVQWLEDAWLLLALPRFSWSVREQRANPRKMYAIDTGLAKANSLSFTEDHGRLLENMVYLHLRRTQKEIFYYRKNKECDFLVFEKKKCQMAIQVCHEITDDNIKRETDGLKEAMDFFGLDEGYIITANQKDELEDGGKRIVIVPVHDFNGIV